MSERTIKMWLGLEWGWSDPSNQNYVISLAPIKFRANGSVRYTSAFQLELCGQGVKELFGATLKPGEVVELMVTMSGKRVKP